MTLMVGLKDISQHMHCIVDLLHVWMDFGLGCLCSFYACNMSVMLIIYTAYNKEICISAHGATHSHRLVVSRCAARICHTVMMTQHTPGKYQSVGLSLNSFHIVKLCFS